MSPVGPVRLMVITDGAAPPAEAVALASVAGGADAVQVRGCATDRATVETAARLVAALRGRPARVLVNARFDLALAAGAHGVHLKDDGLSPRDVRAAARAAGAPGDFVVGVSAHDAAGLVRAAREGADHATFGPVGDAHGRAGLGREAIEASLREARAAGGLPPCVLLLGGVTEADAAWARRLGAEGCEAGLAGIRLFGDASDLGGVTERARRLAAGLGLVVTTSIASDPGTTS